MVFKNPFRFFEWSKYDLRHQARNLHCRCACAGAARRRGTARRGAQTEEGDGCSARANGGQLFVRNTAGGRALLARMVSLRSEIESGAAGQLDQDYVVAAAAAANASRCALPKTRFAGYCSRAHRSGSAAARLVSFHAHCCASHGDKKLLIEAVASAVLNGTRSATLKQVLTAPVAGRLHDWQLAEREGLLTRLLGGAAAGGAAHGVAGRRLRDWEPVWGQAAAAAAWSGAADGGGGAYAAAAAAAEYE